MAQRKIARTTKGRKRPTEKATRRTVPRVEKPGKSPAPQGGARAETPLPEGLVERAAERAGINPAGFAPEEQAAIDGRQRDGLPVSAFGKALVKQLRSEGASTETVAHVLRHEAHGLDDLAKLITPPPAVRDSMLKDALEIIEEAESIYVHDGDRSNLLAEAIRSAKEDVELFEYASGNISGGASEMAFIRAENRLSLALKLDAFRKKHPSWKPAKVEQTDASDETEGTEPAKEGAV
jgi:hypothetical protein